MLNWIFEINSEYASVDAVNTMHLFVFFNANILVSLLVVNVQLQVENEHFTSSHVQKVNITSKPSQPVE